MAQQQASGFPDSPRSVLLANSNQLIREGIAHILEDAGFQVLGQAITVRELRHLAAQRSPDIMMLDWELPDGGVKAIEALCAEYPRSIVVIVTRPQPPNTIMEGMQAGASGYLSVNLSSEELVSSLRMIAQGDMIISREMAEHVMDEFASIQGENQPAEALSDREREVLSLVGQGATNKEIAETLIITENTVKVHLRNILDKLDLRNRQQAAAFAAQEGLVEDVRPEGSESRN